FLWWIVFFYRYATITQLLTMAIAFNILKFVFNLSEINLWFYWIIPALLSSFQLFFFGTYIPHRKPHTEEMQPHNARTLPKNHLLAFLTCYFFGYHREHHEGPHIPWWKLWKTKET
ncbi:MAG: fatty acid desaturase, partial [Ignavibacteria bacterium]|nr:fatty acid desaturase [Ignavibacteria bacterium]